MIAPRLVGRRSHRRPRAEGRRWERCRGRAGRAVQLRPG